VPVKENENGEIARYKTLVLIAAGCQSFYRGRRTAMVGKANRSMK
jgi:RecB family endonuclease NucS